MYAILVVAARDRGLLTPNIAYSSLRRSSYGSTLNVPASCRSSSPPHIDSGTKNGQNVSPMIVVTPVWIYLNLMHIHFADFSPGTIGREQY